MRRASGVPIRSARAPNGRALRGMAPKAIMGMLIIRPLIRGSDSTCVMVMVMVIDVALIAPIATRNGVARI